MCGIAVIWGRRDRGIVEAMLEAQAHRGPDGQGIHEPDGVPAVMGHRRLAIIDPATGIQPLLAEGDRSLVANGMIYNDRALRAELGADGFRTGSDSESILRCLIARGPDGVGGLDGMFAFVMQDGDRLIAGRDPLGIKPLYVGHDEGAILFASEIKALAPFTDRIRAVPPGSLIDTQGGSRRYYALPPAEPRFRDLDEAVAALRRTVEASVVKRLRSDVPLGCLLSGGLDSSIVCAVARQHLPELHTFAVGLEGSEDLRAARLVARHLGTIHHELVVDPESVLEELPRVVAHLESFDQDLVRSAVPCWLVSRLAAGHVKVILTGEGADELFAGYRYHRDYADRSELALELRRSLEAMHDVNLQRVDRMTMAHGLEARVPFLDRDLVALAMRLPVGWKLFSEGERRIEKWILRKAFADLLPEEIVWRDKSQFDQGSGFADLLERLATPLGQSLPGSRAGPRGGILSAAAARGLSRAAGHRRSRRTLERGPGHRVTGRAPRPAVQEEDGGAGHHQEQHADRGGVCRAVVEGGDRGGDDGRDDRLGDTQGRDGGTHILPVRHQGKRRAVGRDEAEEEKKAGEARDQAPGAAVAEDRDDEVERHRGDRTHQAHAPSRARAADDGRCGR